MIFGAVLFLPFTIKKVEEELEIFLFVMGCLAVTVTSQWSLHLIEEGLVEPIKITVAVFLAGIVFRSLQKYIATHVNKIVQTLGVKVFAFLLIVVLGLLSSILTAIIASLILVEMGTAKKV